MSPLPQLAVLAAAAVVARILDNFAIGDFLAGHAQPHARDRLAARCGNLRAALGARLERRPGRQPTLGALDRILHGRVDLILDRAFFRPTGCHGYLVR